MWFSSPANYAQTVSNGRWQMANHLALIDKVTTRLIYDHNLPIDKARPTLPRILIIEAPPRHGKSEYISKYLPSWYLSLFPHKRVILTSYGKDLSRNFGRFVKDQITHYGPKYFGINVKTDHSAASDWDIATLNGTSLGGMLSAGIGGSITGFGAHLFIIDDFCKNAEEALSPKLRDKWWDTFQTTLQTRMEPNGIIILIATRWHNDDLVGRLTGESDKDYEWNEPYIRLQLPALAIETELDNPFLARRHNLSQLKSHLSRKNIQGFSLGNLSDQAYLNHLLARKPGDPLWPERHTKKILDSTKSNLDNYWWQSLYMQNPGRSDRAEWPDHYFENIFAEV